MRLKRRKPSFSYSRRAGALLGRTNRDVQRAPLASSAARAEQSMRVPWPWRRQSLRTASRAMCLLLGRPCDAARDATLTRPRASCVCRASRISQRFCGESSCVCHQSAVVIASLTCSPSTSSISDCRRGASSTVAKRRRGSRQSASSRTQRREASSGSSMTWSSSEASEKPRETSQGQTLHTHTRTLSCERASCLEFCSVHVPFSFRCAVGVSCVVRRSGPFASQDSLFLKKKVIHRREQSVTM